jgi:hypothetical protein
MPKTISDPKFRRAREFIDSQAEPRIKQIVEQLNAVLGKHGIRVGAEVNWLFDEVEIKPEGNEDDDDA